VSEVLGKKLESYKAAEAYVLSVGLLSCSDCADLACGNREEDGNSLHQGPGKRANRFSQALLHQFTWLFPLSLKAQYLSFLTVFLPLARLDACHVEKNIHGGRR